MNPVENKQPSECSEWAMNKANELWFQDVWTRHPNEAIKLIAKELDSLKSEAEVYKSFYEEQIRVAVELKSQANGLAEALDRITTYKWTHQPSILEWGRILAIGQRSLQAYRKVDKQ